MPNASVGVQRVLRRLRLGQRPPTTAPNRTVRQALSAHAMGAHLGTTSLRTGLSAGHAAGRRLRHGLRSRVAGETALPVAVAGIVLGASVLSILPDAFRGGPTGNTAGAGSEARIALGGAAFRDVVVGQHTDGLDGVDGYGGFRPIDPEALALREEPGAPQGGTSDGSFLEDGTLVTPVAPDTTLSDGSGLLQRYSVRAGDTLTGVAGRFGVSMMTIWWANRLTTKDLHIGQILTIPPVNGLVLTVREGDTLDSISANYKVSADAIYQLNGLEDRVLIVGQTLILPGATGQPIATPPPAPKPATKPPGGGTSRPPSTYTGGRFTWPVVGGGNYISQYFHYGHYAIDIAADYGSTVRAAAGGTVIFAGWKSNGGGYQVWISHGSNLYTTYNHMSSITVGRGQSVGRGQQVGRVGQSGNATGPHLHFEVWRGPVWNGGARVNPMLYY